LNGGELGKRIIAGLLFSVLAGLVLVAASRAQLLPAAPDKFTYDWRTYFLAEQAPHPRGDIAIIRIDERSLTGYNYVSPIDRGLIAEIVKSADAAGAKAIGLDVIVDRPTEPQKDAALAEAIRQAHAPVILGAVDGRGGESAEGLAFQEDFIAKTGRQAGHIFFAAERDQLTLSDQAVRFMLPPSEQPRRPSFAHALADLDGKKPEPASPLIFWRRPPASGGADLFTAFTVPPHRDADGNPKGSVLPESWRGALAGKIVLIGGGFTDRDLHLTPLTVASHEPIHGVGIHAQILAQLRDGRSIHEMPWWVEFLIAAAVAGLGFYAAIHWRTLSGSGVASTTVAFLVIVTAGSLLFWTAHIILPSATLFLAWALGLFAGSWTGALGAKAAPLSDNEAKMASGG
jgi:CHASE2 domain-containing sensor protein